MSAIDDGGPAFPEPDKGEYYGSNNRGAHPGLSVRDYFAAKAMEAYIGSVPFRSTDWIDSDKWVSVRAYELADAMLEARKS